MKYLSILISLVLFSGCRQDKPGDEKQAAEQQITGNQIRLSDEQLKIVSPESILLEKKQIAGVLQLNGKVDVNPDHRVSLSSALGGHISSVNVLPGQPVKKGEIILVLEDNQFIQIQQDYLNIKAQLLSAEPNYLRQKELNSSKAASDKTFQLAETEYRSLLVARSALEEKLRLIHIDPVSLTPDHIKRSATIAAPFDGVVSRVLVNKGKYVSPSDVLVELINPQGLLLSIKVFEKDWPKVAVGQLLQAYTNENPERKIQARIITKGNVINDDGSAEIIAKVIDRGGVKLVAGLYVNAALNLENIETYTLPEDAVVSFSGKSYVFVFKDNNVFDMTEVEIGKTRDGKTEIVNYQAISDKRIVGKGAYALLMAAKNKAEESVSGIGLPPCLSNKSGTYILNSVSA